MNISRIQGIFPLTLLFCWLSRDQLKVQGHQKTLQAGWTNRKYWNSNVSNLTPFPLCVNLLVMHVAQLIVPANLPVSNLPPFACRQRFAPLAACSDSAAQPNAFKRLWFTQFEQLVLGSGKGQHLFYVTPLCAFQLDKLCTTGHRIFK